MKFTTGPCHRVGKLKTNASRQRKWRKRIRPYIDEEQRVLYAFSSTWSVHPSLRSFWVHRFGPSSATDGLLIHDEDKSYPWDDPDVMVGDVRRTVRDIEASGGPRVFE